MANPEELREVLDRHLHPYFEHKKYFGTHPEIDYMRKTSFGHSAIVCPISITEDGIYLEFFLGIRHTIIEEQLAFILGRSDYYHSISHSLMVNMGSIDKKMWSRVFCTTQEEVIKAGNQFIDFMDRTGFSFLDHYKSLRAIDNFFNEQSELAAEMLKHSYQRVFRAMIVAKTLNNENYDRYFWMHQQYLSERGFKGELLSIFNTTFARMQKVSMN